MSAICNAAISLNRIKYSKNTTRKDSIKYNSFISAYIACVVGIKKGGGEGGRKVPKGKRKGAERRLLPLSSIPLPFSLPPYSLPLSTPATQATTYTESGAFADSGRVEQILSRTNLFYKLPGPPLRVKEKVKQHLIRDKLNSCQKQKPQEIIDH